MTGRTGARVLLLVPLLASCAYYNAMWRAEQFAKEARRLEERGRPAEARQFWARATVKAETVLARHPTSRWADDALVLRGEGLARSGRCEAAAEPLAAARRTVSEPALLERAALAAAGCALDEGAPREAARLLAALGDSPDARRRAWAGYLAGRAAQSMGDRARAVEAYGRSTLVESDVARLTLLVELERIDEVMAGIPALARRPVPEAQWGALLGALALAAGAPTASTALDRLLDGARMPTGERARLLLADGDRLRGVGLTGAAAARYRAAAGGAADSVEGGIGRVRLLRLRAAAVTDSATLAVLIGEARGLARSAVGMAATDALAAERVLRLAAGPHETVAAEFRGAEIARDSLGAATLAARLFLDLARRHTESLFAPKALVAALALDPPGRDSIVQVLESTYAASPYTLAFRGVPSPAYAAAEDSLARALGVVVQPPASAARVAPAPTPGPRGPALDEPVRPAVPSQGATPRRDRARPRAVEAR